MDSYLLLRFVHITALSAWEVPACSLISELRPTGPPMSPRSPRRLGTTATFYDALVVPGRYSFGASETFLVFVLGLGFLSEPWLAGMWGLFC